MPKTDMTIKRLMQSRPTDWIEFLIPESKASIFKEIRPDKSFQASVNETVSNELSGIEEAFLFIPCLCELVANAIEHGNRFNPEKTVSVEWVTTAGYLQSTVEDRGDGFCWQEKIDRLLEMDGNEERGAGYGHDPYVQRIFNLQ